MWATTRTAPQSLINSHKQVYHNLNQDNQYARNNEKWPCYHIRHIDAYYEGDW